MFRLKWTLIAAGLLSAVGCEQNRSDRQAGAEMSKDMHRNDGQSGGTAAVNAEQSKEEYQQQLDDRLKEVNAEIAKLREKGSNLQDEAKAKWERELPKLEAKRDLVAAELTELRKSSAAAWKDVKHGAQSAWDDLDHAFRDASKHF